MCAGFPLGVRRGIVPDDLPTTGIGAGPAAYRRIVLIGLRALHRVDDIHPEAQGFSRSGHSDSRANLTMAVEFPSWMMPPIGGKVCFTVTSASVHRAGLPSAG